MTIRAIRPVALAVCLATVSVSSRAQDSEPSLKLFDGKPRVFVVNGYSTIWFRTLLEHDGLTVPDWSRQEMEAAVHIARASADPPARRAAEVGQDEPIDWDKARQLRRRALAGEKLSEEEQEYLDRAMRLRRGRGGAVQRRPPEAQASTGLVPLSDMADDDTYKQQDGGLYGGGRNEPPDSHLRAALEQAAKIQPLDADGHPAPDGKIVLLSVGMSNTTQEFQTFMRLAADDPQASPSLTIVDGAQGGMEAFDWAHPERRFRRDGPSPWDVLDQRLQQAAVSAPQVQVVWIKQARRNPASLGEFPGHAEELKENLAVLLHRLKERFPNLRLAYLSSRIYAGYAGTPLNPEPYAYESAFAVRRLIQEQIQGRPDLNADPRTGDVKAPLVLWGPYLWADGTKGRGSDDLVWRRDDLAADGTHPSPGGREKVARLLLTFFKSDPTAKTWFRRNP